MEGGGCVIVETVTFYFTAFLGVLDIGVLDIGVLDIRNDRISRHQFRMEFSTSFPDGVLDILQFGGKFC